MDLLDIFHVKATESLFRSLENLKQKSYRIVLTSGENGMQLRIITADNESSFQLNPEGTISNYFSVSEVLGSSGTFIGLFTGRLRVEANEESFKHAREGLIKDVEQNRQQKLEMLMYQAESASLLKTERIKKSQKSLKRVAPSKKPPSKVATTKDTDSSTTPQVAHHENKAKKTHAVKHTTVKPLDYNQSTVSNRPTLNDRINTPKLSRSSDDPFVDDRAGLLKADDRLHSNLSARDRCLDAVERRRSLQKRFAAALSEPDRTLKEELIEEIRADLFALVEELQADVELRQLKKPVDHS